MALGSDKGGLESMLYPREIFLVLNVVVITFLFCFGMQFSEH